LRKPGHTIIILRNRCPKARKLGNGLVPSTAQNAALHCLQGALERSEETTDLPGHLPKRPGPFGDALVEAPKEGSAPSLRALVF